MSREQRCIASSVQRQIGGGTRPGPKGKQPVSGERPIIGGERAVLAYWLTLSTQTVPRLDRPVERQNTYWAPEGAPLCYSEGSRVDVRFCAMLRVQEGEVVSLGLSHLRACRT